MLLNLPRICMQFIFSLIILAITALLYVECLRLAGKWVLKTSLSRKLCWIFFGLIIAIAVLNRLVAIEFSRPASTTLGLIAHLLFGAWFFGSFAVNKENIAPGFVNGLKLIGVAMGLMLITCIALVGLSTLLLSEF